MFPCGVQLDWVRNSGQRCSLSPTLSHPESEPLLIPEMTSSGRFSRKALDSSVIQQQLAFIEKNLSVFGGLPDASLKTSAFHVVCDQGSDLNNKLFTKPFSSNFLMHFYLCYILLPFKLFYFKSPAWVVDGH